MTTPRIKRVITLALATVLGAGTLGCGLISQAKGIANAASVVSDFSNRLGKAQTLTYTAEYKMADGTTATLVQQPPNAAFIGKDGRFIFTADAIYTCSTAKSVMTCQKSPNTTTKVDASDSAYIGSAVGAGFVTPELAIGVILAAGFVPGAKIDESDKTIAGQSSKCATASGLDAAASPGDTSAPKDFTVCVTDAGVLASFSGTTTDGVKTTVEMTSYSDKADPSAFQPPAGAIVIDNSVVPS